MYTTVMLTDEVCVGCTDYRVCIWVILQKNNLVFICYEVVGSATRRQPTVAEMSKLENEINFLKRSLDVSISGVCVVFASFVVFNQ